MAVVDLRIENRTPYADGAAFGQVGPYERIDGVLEFAVDPTHTANGQIVDLGLAPREADGLVHFIADLTLLQPVDAAKGNQRLLVDVVNRGRRNVVPTFNLAVPNRKGSADIPAGDGFLFERGWTIAAIGWQWDVFRRDGMMGMEPPTAPVRGQTLVELRPDVVQHTRTLANRVHKSIPAADLDDADAVLYVKDWEDGPYSTIARADWRFARETDEGVEPSAEHVYLAAGFQPGKIYHLVFTAEGSPVGGCGLLALRDGAAFLRQASALNPIDGGLERAYVYGVSQTGRLLRHFLYLGLNQDEQGAQVYDGMLPHVAGGRRGEFNQRFGQPSVQSTPGFGHVFPFADDDLQDPFGGSSDGLLRRERAQGTTPRIIYTNTAAEYWRGDASLIHVDAATGKDLPDAEGTRSYLFAGTQHADARQLPEPGDPAIDGTLGRYPSNALDYRPLLRAALVNLDRWVSDGVAPPPSAVPTVAGESAVSRAAALDALSVVPDLAAPDPDRLWVLRETDLGPQADEGVARFPVVEGRAYDSFVSAVDADGNESAGIRLPDLSVPVATHAGWNPRHPDAGAPEQIIPMVGFTLFFPRNDADRQAAHDARRSIEERYASREAYLAESRTAAEALVAARTLLAEDVDVVVENCARTYDLAMAGD
jgi:hypothetical protein